MTLPLVAPRKLSWPGGEPDTMTARPSGGRSTMQPTCSTSSPPVSATPALELGRLSLMDALALVVLYARVSSPKFEPAAVRWLARLALEGREVGPADVQLAAARACVSSRKRDRRARTRAQPTAQPPAEAGGSAVGVSKP